MIMQDQVNATPIPIKLIVSEVYSDVAEDAGDSIARDLNPEADAGVSGDRELLTQMFANLIENAIRHCPAPAAIRLKISADGNQVPTSIENSGPGIPEDERGKVFRRLYRLDKSRASAGKVSA
jgi:signal transduction histidine kinase